MSFAQRWFWLLIVPFAFAMLVAFLGSEDDKNNLPPSAFEHPQAETPMPHEYLQRYESGLEWDPMFSDERDYDAGVR